VEIDLPAPFLVRDSLGDDAADVDLAAAIALEVKAAEAQAVDRL